MSAPFDQIADLLVDRRKILSRVRRWRMLALLGVVLGVLLAAFGLSKGLRGLGDNNHIARIAIEGLITDDADTLRLIDTVRKSKAAAVIVAINSPGGTTTGAEKLYIELRRLAQEKPVVTVLGTLAASGGYIAALSGDHIVAERNSLVGSIGVLFQFPNFAHLLDTVGVKVEEVKSAPLKAAPNGFEPTSPAARQALADLVADSYTWFKDLVKSRRLLSDSELQTVSDGRVFTGHQALDLKLIDELGGEREAIAWLEKEKHIKHDLPIQDWKKEQALDKFGLFNSASRLLQLSMHEGLAAALQDVFYGAAPQLDGLLVLWRP